MADRSAEEEPKDNEDEEVEESEEFWTLTSGWPTW